MGLWDGGSGIIVGPYSCARCFPLPPQPTPVACSLAVQTLTVMWSHCGHWFAAPLPCALALVLACVRALARVRLRACAELVVTLRSTVKFRLATKAA
eukprot:881635-Amphidinium_carterae.1